MIIWLVISALAKYWKYAHALLSLYLTIGRPMWLFLVMSAVISAILIYRYIRKLCGNTKWRRKWNFGAVSWKRRRNYEAEISKPENRLAAAIWRDMKAAEKYRDSRKSEAGVACVSGRRSSCEELVAERNDYKEKMCWLKAEKKAWKLILIQSTALYDLLLH